VFFLIFSVFSVALFLKNARIVLSFVYICVIMVTFVFMCVFEYVNTGVDVLSAAIHVCCHAV